MKNRIYYKIGIALFIALAIAQLIVVLATHKYKDWVDDAIGCSRAALFLAIAWVLHGALYPSETEEDKPDQDIDQFDISSPTLFVQDVYKVLNEMLPHSEINIPVSNADPFLLRAIFQVHEVDIFIRAKQTDERDKRQNPHLKNIDVCYLLTIQTVDGYTDMFNGIILNKTEFRQALRFVIRLDSLTSEHAPGN